MVKDGGGRHSVRPLSACTIPTYLRPNRTIRALLGARCDDALGFALFCSSSYLFRPYQFSSI